MGGTAESGRGGERSKSLSSRGVDDKFRTVNSGTDMMIEVLEILAATGCKGVQRLLRKQLNERRRSQLNSLSSGCKNDPEWTKSRQLERL